MALGDGRPVPASKAEEHERRAIHEHPQRKQASKKSSSSECRMFVAGVTVLCCSGDQHHQRGRALRVLDPIFWAEEILVFIVIWTVFLVAGAITYRGAHLNMDLLYSGFSHFWKRVINTAIALSLIVCSLFTAYAVLEGRPTALSQSWRHCRYGYPARHSAFSLLFGFTFMALAAICALSLLYHRQIRLKGRQPCIGSWQFCPLCCCCWASQSSCSAHHLAGDPASRFSICR